MQSMTLCFLCCCLALAVGQNPPMKVVCYYTSWARYRVPLARFTPLNINPHLCTHLHYAVVNTDEEQRLGPADAFSDIMSKGYEQFVTLKDTNPNLKVLMFLGGSATLQQEAFLETASDPSKTERFVANAIQYIRKHNFDGVDIDWKVAGKKEEHARLLEALMAGFRAEAEESERERLLVSATMTANVTKAQEDFDVVRVTRAVDYVNLLSYTFHSSTANVTGHHAPLFAVEPGSTDHIDFSVETYRQLGADLSRMVLIAPSFGVSFTLSDARLSGLGAPAAGPGIKGKLTKLNGALSFTEICEHVSLDDWEAFRPQPSAVGPYAVGGDQWVAFDDERMMRRKGAYVLQKGLGGAGLWTLAQDDFRGFCTGRPYPLIEALKEGMRVGTATTTTPRPPTTPTFDNTPVFTCPGDGRFPKPDDCSLFYTCTDGVAKALPCEMGLRYDAEKGFCSQEATCIPRPVIGVSRFPTTPAPSAIESTIIASMGPSTTQSTTPRPVTTSEPENTSSKPDAEIFNAVEKPESTTEMVIDRDIESSADFKQLLELIRSLGGLNRVQDLLRMATHSQITNASPDQKSPRLTDEVVSRDVKVRVHVTVEVL